MPQLRLALAQVNPTVGDLAGNADLVLEWAKKADAAGAHVVAFPELMLTGYPVEDLVFRASFVAATRQALDQLAADLAADGLGELVCVVGYLDACRTPRTGSASPGLPAERRRGAARRPGRGQLRQAPPAQLRGLRRGPLLRARRHHPVVQVHGVDVAICICEDLWQDGPSADARPPRPACCW